MATKLILDACCGGRMSWFDKAHPNALYVDIRQAHPGHREHRPNHSVLPDEIVDFRNMPYEDESFKLILFDPPHVRDCRFGKNSDLKKVYGSLPNEDWENYLTDGFLECWRVLMPHGVLIFKWSSAKIPLKKVLACFPVKPLFGHTTSVKGLTHWMTFMKL